MIKTVGELRAALAKLDDTEQLWLVLPWGTTDRSGFLHLEMRGLRAMPLLLGGGIVVEVQEIQSSDVQKEKA